ncbi:3'-5' exonuclease [Zafaria sp. Z1313]|uniref:3'-5' exonuclease n=1 Tax=unclassified Zafaria TaxID=2828765 RepID=UPI002E7A86B0|nr:3'-5' exonuclease [Zafaria sp. J156]MEE1620355.1 3'-5' exonuclease [Zafaria sp. J156]
MSNWHELPRASFDLETTGRDPELARIVTASVLVVNGRQEILNHREWLVDPGVPIPEEAAAIHGVSTERARAEGADAATAVAEITAHLRELFATMPVLAFNASYDFTVLDRECLRHGVEALEPAAVIDPYIIDKHVDKYRRGKRTLTVMSEFYRVPLVDAHTSVADAAATVGVADAQVAKYKQLRMDPLQLHGSQVRWAAEQAASFQAYLRRKDPSAVVDGQWPVRRRP